MYANNYNSSRKNYMANADENTYCIILNIAKGTEFHSEHLNNDDLNGGLILKVSLKGVVFEVEGNFTQSKTVAFNSNCIWECVLDDVKRIKTDNRQIKLDFFFKNDFYMNETPKRLGLLMLSLRGVKIINSLTNLQIKPRCCKLSSLNPKCCSNNPQIYFTIAIVKKSIIEHNNLEKINPFVTENPGNNGTLTCNVTHTTNMLHSQFGLFVKLLEDVGQIQVGNNLQLDCDIFCVTITFKQIKNVIGLMNISQTSMENSKRSFVLQYDFLGSISNLEFFINKNDCYTINQKVSLNIRSSLSSLQMYFNRIFYIPMYLYLMNNTAIARYNLNISPFLPKDINYFNKNDVGLWIKQGFFNFDYLNENTCATYAQPMLEFAIKLELITKNNNDIECNFSRAINFEKISNMSENNDAEQRHKTNHKNNVNKSVYTVAVNTDVCFESEMAMKLYLYYIKQFNKWKRHEIFRFLNELSHVKEIYMQNLQERWDYYKDVLIARLETKITKFEEMLTQFENLQHQLNNAAATNIEIISIAADIKENFESIYKTQFIQLEKKVELLQKSVEVKEIENADLKKYVDHLENQLTLCKISHISIDQLKGVLDDMRMQANRFARMECFYKVECFGEINKLKHKILQLLNVQKSPTKLNMNFNLEEILNDETSCFQLSNAQSNKILSVHSSRSTSSAYIF